MNISPSAIDLIDAIKRYIEESSKINYRFTIEEQFEIQKQIKILDNQINILIDYEIKREQEKNKKSE